MSFENLRGANYMSLVTFRRDGTPVATPVWFAEEDRKLYVVSAANAFKVKRISKNPRVEVAPSTFRGKVTGEKARGIARILPREDWPAKKKLIGKKYFLHRLSFSSKNVYIEIAPE